ncbi:MAG: Hsp70 family protein [Planctomycetota bacterium]
MELIVGIDLGTTNSEIAVIRDGRPEVIRIDGEAILPSIVGLDSEGRLLVGTPARNQWVLAPERTVRSIKRKMGEDYKVRLGDRDYAPQEISAIILGRLKERAEQFLGQPVRKAVITVPAFFNEVQREATREAGELAGLEVVRIINEPTAAALTYDPATENLERLLVYDLGGGTFDVSIVQVERGVVEVLASHGNTHLGGDDFDELLLTYVCDKFEKEHKVDLRKSPVGKSRVLGAVEEAKKILSAEAVTTIQEEFIAKSGSAALHLDLEIERVEYEALIEPLLAKTLICVDQALDDAHLNAQQIDKVILVGGASRTPLVHRLLEGRLGRELHTEVDPDLCVAMGAAVQGGLINGIDVGQVLVDITPHTLGISVLGELDGILSGDKFSPVIHRNTPLPATRSEMFTTAHDGQKAAMISVYQGENEDVQLNQFIGEFLLEGLASINAGNEILVRFALDLNGILKVTALEHDTGLQKQLTVENAVSRFRRDSQPGGTGSALRQPIEVASQSLASGGGDHAAADVPADVAAAIAKSSALISKAQGLATKASEEDRQEIARLIKDLRDAAAARSIPRLEQVGAALEDLVFYLQDA